MMTKVTVNIPDELVAFLKKTAAEEQISVSDVLRRSINTEKFFIQQQKSGHKILVESDNQQIREVIRA